MVTFQAKLTAGLGARGVQVTYDLADEPYDSILIIGGTRDLVGLRKAQRRGVPIVQRLDGMNWLHKRVRTGPRHWLRAEISNWLLAYIRERLANRIMYQSRFVLDWWRRVHGAGPSNYRIVHNGVDLTVFIPEGPEQPPADRIRVLMVEGNLQGGYELGLASAVSLAEQLQGSGQPVELVIAGSVDGKTRSKWNQRAKVKLTWLGVIPNSNVPALNRGAHFLYSSDINAACPNSVIEALACGLPVLAFDTGALSELVPAAAGRVVPYGGDPWKLDLPDLPSLLRGAQEIMANQAAVRGGARQHAEQTLGLDRMVQAYVEALSA
jgi:glycosyltransferase involved in cell wall biosynthesis